LKKIEYSEINIVLVCDDSGSMSGTPRDDLCAAIKKFAEKTNTGINIGVVRSKAELTTVRWQP